MTRLLDRIARFDAHHRLLISLGVAALAAGVLGLRPDPPATDLFFVVIWLAYAGTVLALAWTTIFRIHPRQIPEISRMEDSGRVLILVFVLVAVGFSLFAVIDLLGAIRGKPVAVAKPVVGLALGAIVSSWLLVHTLFTLRYAHLFYDDSPQGRKKGGLRFPDEPEPDYLDFAYFSFVIGMTGQVSDVEITSRSIRRLALLHGLLSFAFNTLLIALSINVLSGLI